MPIVATVQVSHVIVKLQFDMIEQVGKATLRKFVGGVPVNDVDVTVTGDAFMAMVNTVPAPGISRGQDITSAVYDYAVSNSGIEGSIE